MLNVTSSPTLFSAAQSAVLPAPPVQKSNVIRFAASTPVDELRFAGPNPGKSTLIDNDVYNCIRAIPKVSLHEHLGGSADLVVAKMELIAAGEREGLDMETLRERLRVTRAEEYGKVIGGLDLHDDEKAGDSKHIEQDDDGLDRYVKKYSENARLTKMKHLENIYMASYLYTLKAARENVRYFEVRTNPYPEEGTAEEMVQFVQQGIEDAQAVLEKSRQKIDYGIILLAYRHGNDEIDPETGRKKKVDAAVDVAEVAVELKEKGYPICGIDLAGGETKHPVTDFGPYFDVVHQYNARMVAQGTPEKRIGITVHAGETATSGKLEGHESIREAIRLAWDENTPVRIGHGTAIVNDHELVKEVQRKKIGLEMCPKSNVQTGAVDWYTNHPAPELSRQGVLVSVSSDNQTVSNTDATNEFVKLYKHRQIGHEDRKRMVLAGLQTAFIFDPEKKAEIIEDALNTFDKLEHKPKMVLARYKEEKSFGHKPALTFSVYDGLYQKALERVGSIQAHTIDMRQELGQLLGRPVTSWEYLPFQVRDLLTDAVAQLADWFKEKTAQLAVLLETGSAQPLPVHPSK